jgi:hypothetical protein
VGRVLPFSTGAGPISLASADLNSDGRLDLVVTNGDAGAVGVLLGNGNGTFQSAVNYATGAAPNSIVPSDFNDDGKLDLAVVNQNGFSLSVLLGTGDGTFQPDVEYPVGMYPLSVAAGDFNRDGKLDVVVTNDTSDNVSVLLGVGDGTFRPAVNYNTGEDPVGVAVGDFNHDGKLDLAVTNDSSFSVSVLLGKGDGTFAGAMNFGVGSEPQSLVVGDFNGDGKLDLAVGNTNSNDVSVLLGRGDGTFQAAVNYAAGPFPLSLSVGDFNGDGTLDLVVTNSTSNTASVLLGNGDGSFQSAVHYAAGQGPLSVVVGDFNRDGRPDFAVADHSSNRVSVLLQSNVRISKTTLTFANQVLGTMSVAQTVTLTNLGPPLNVSSITVTGINGEDFAQTNNCGTTVPVGASCAINVAFKPGGIGPRTGSLRIQDTSPGSPHSVALAGTGVVSGPNANLSSSKLTFATQIVGTTSGGKAVKLTNYGTASLSISSITASGDYIQSHTCGSTVAAGASCTINVGFRPTAINTRMGTLSVTDNAPGGSQSVSLSGTGTVVKLVPSSLSFSCRIVYPRVCQCTSTTGTSTLTNTGTTPLGISGISITGAFSKTTTCGSNLGAGQSCGINVTWSRFTSGGAVSISDNGGGSPQTVSLSGYAQCRPF